MARIIKLDMPGQASYWLGTDGTVWSNSYSSTCLYCHKPILRRARYCSKKCWYKLYRSNGCSPVRNKNRMRITGQVASNGYVRVTINKKRYLLHRLVLTTFVGPPPDGYVAMHLNGNPQDNRLQNLKWGTQSENCRNRKPKHIPF